MNESRRTYEWVISHIWRSHVTQMNESCHTYEWMMFHVWIRHVTHTNGYQHRRRRCNQHMRNPLGDGNASKHAQCYPHMCNVMQTCAIRLRCGWCIFRFFAVAEPFVLFTSPSLFLLLLILPPMSLKHVLWDMSWDVWDEMNIMDIKCSSDVTCVMNGRQMRHETCHVTCHMRHVMSLVSWMDIRCDMKHVTSVNSLMSIHSCHHSSYLPPDVHSLVVIMSVHSCPPCPFSDVHQVHSLMCIMSIHSLMSIMCIHSQCLSYPFTHGHSLMFIH